MVPTVNPERMEVQDHDVAIIVTAADKQTRLATLTLRPIALEFLQTGAWRANYVHTALMYSSEDLSWSSQDYLTLGSYVDLRDLFLAYQEGRSGILEMESVEAGFFLQVARQEPGGNIALVMRVPSITNEELTQHFTSPGPGTITTAVFVQCVIGALDLVKAVEDLAAFLIHLKDLTHSCDI
jgi:hypothetical protein